MKTELLTISCDLIMTGDGQFLTDHHNRDNELLISAYPSLDKESMFQEFWESAICTDKIPQSIPDSEIKVAIQKLVDSLLPFELCLTEFEDNSEVQV
jgi:hypothetical protein